jgi:flagellar biosynthetic protein FliR
MKFSRLEKDNIWLLTSFHVLTGLTIGYILKIIMGIFVSAGAIMTQQMGFSAVSYFDPTYAAKVGPIEKLIQWTLIIMIISSGGLLPIFKGALNSFHTLSFLNAAVWAKPAHFYYDFFKSLIVMALILSSPIFVFKFITQYGFRDCC